MPDRSCPNSCLCAKRLGLPIGADGKVTCTCGRTVRILHRHAGGTHLESHVVPRDGEDEAWRRACGMSPAPKKTEERICMACGESAVLHGQSIICPQCGATRRAEG